MSLPDSQSMSLSHTGKRPRTRSYLPREAEGVESGATESEAVRLLAARIPPELFEDILFYVNVDRVSQRPNWNPEGDALERNHGEPSSKDTLTDLKQCSLVCLFWANRCRQYMFSGRTVWINAHEDAKIFRQYIVGGCPRLTPVHRLIESIRVAQKYSGMWASQGSGTLTSFLHLLYIPAVQDKLKELYIEGPVPDGFNPAKLDTPHWGIPPCTIVVPSSFLKEILLKNVHFPSFRHVTKYMRHFTCATYIQLWEITWDGQTPTYSLPQASNELACQRRPRTLTVQTGGCTDSVHLALTALMMNPNCPLHRLSDEERVWMIKFMTLLWGDKKDPDVSFEFDVSEQTATMRTSPFSFAFEEAPASADRSVSALSAAGMHTYIYDSDKLPANFDALVNHARTHPTIRALVLLFESLDYLQETMKPFAEVLTLATGTIELVLAYEDEEERRAVGVDLVTLEPNDCLWAELRGLYREDKSLEILQRQLKKKRWMSLH